MISVPLARQVLVLTDDVSIRNLFYLMRRLASEDTADGSVRAVAAIAERDDYDAVVLEMRCLEDLAVNNLYGIGKVQSSWLERMLTIVAEVDGPATPALIEQYLFNGLPEAHQWLASRCHSSQMQMRPC